MKRREERSEQQMKPSLKAGQNHYILKCGYSKLGRSVPRLGGALIGNKNLDESLGHKNQ
jgi:hypothetical protein